MNIDSDFSAGFFFYFFVFSWEGEKDVVSRFSNFNFFCRLSAHWQDLSLLLMKLLQGSHLPILPSFIVLTHNALSLCRHMYEYVPGSGIVVIKLLRCHVRLFVSPLRNQRCLFVSTVSVIYFILLSLVQFQFWFFLEFCSQIWLHWISTSFEYLSVIYLTS